MNHHPVTDAITSIAPPKRSRLACRLAPHPPEPIEHGAPRAELARLVKQHAWWTRDVQRMTAMVSDRTTKAGVPIPHNKPESVVDDVTVAAKSLDAAADRLVRAMGRQLEGVPIYEELFAKIDGVGPKLSAYLIAMVDISKCPKVSRLIRYCGNAPDPKTGRAERRHAGPKSLDPTSDGTFNQPLKIALVQGMRLGMWMGSVRPGKPGGKMNKYLRRWVDAKHAAQTFPNARLGRVMRPGEADDKGRKKATDLLLWDIYVMWRTLEGLPVMADKFSNERGVFHGGVPVWEGARVLTLDEARAIVGDVTSHPFDWPAKTVDT